MRAEDDYEYDDEEGIFEERSREEVEDIVEELTDRVWYNRHLDLREVDPGIWKEALAAAKKIEDKYGVDNLGPYDDFEWGMLNGKLSALRWILGFEWDMLDT